MFQGPNDNGLVDPKLMCTTATNLGFEETNPTIFAMIKEITQPKVGPPPTKINFQQFLDALTNNLGNTQTNKGVKRIFQLF